MPNGSTRSIDSRDTAKLAQAAKDAQRMQEQIAEAKAKAEEKRRKAAEKKEAKLRQKVAASYERGAKKYGGEQNLLARIFDRKG